MKKFFKSVLFCLGEFLCWFFTKPWLFAGLIWVISFWVRFVDPLIGQTFDRSAWISFYETADINFQMTLAGAGFVSVFCCFFLQVISQLVFWLVVKFCDFVMGLIKRAKEKKESYEESSE